jgi:hypothetical protein
MRRLAGPARASAKLVQLAPIKKRWALVMPRWVALVELLGVKRRAIAGAEKSGSPAAFIVRKGESDPASR